MRKVYDVQGKFQYMGYGAGVVLPTNWVPKGCVHLLFNFYVT